ncbi:MAG: LysM peptidoglycan-binding domain-containing protein [Candidatus Sericytochromatia bacterium]|nr:LysM peptidoglycan-binding domain-containing protein [Candidatus Sericytochromatia bacterium]
MNINRTHTPPPQTPAAGAAAQLQTHSYTVRSGDSLWQIAQRELGNGDAWPDLYAQNREAIGPDPNRLQPGTVLQVQGRTVPTPSPRPAADPAGETASAASENSYTVRSGDSLWKIAERELGNGAAWPELYALNQETIGPSPDRLQPGMVLQLRPADPAAAPASPAEALPEDTAPAQPELPAAGSAAPSVPLLDEEPEVPADPPAATDVPDDATAPVLVEEAPEQPAGPVVSEDAAPAATDVPDDATASVLVEEAPEQPAGPAVNEDAAPAVPADAAPPATVETPAQPPAPAADPAPAVETSSPPSPLQSQVESLVRQVDRRGQNAAVHADPVGGIPQVIRATDELLALYNSGELNALPDGPLREQAEAWVLDAAAARTGKALQGWSGFAESENQALQHQLQSPAFQALPAERQERLVQQAALSHEILISLPDLRPDQQQVLQALAPWLGAPLAEAPPAPSAEAAGAPEPMTEAPEPPAAPAPLASAAVPATAEAPAPAALAPQSPVPPAAESPAVVPAPDTPPAVASEAPAAPAAPAADSAPPAAPQPAQGPPEHATLPEAPVTPAAESLPQVQPSPAETLQIRAEVLLERIDGRGYTASHHGDPVGGIPQVAEAMGEVLGLVNSGENKILADAQLQQRLESWATEIAAARFSREAQRWDGFSEGQAASLNQHLNSAAFNALPAERQHQLLQALTMTYDIARSLPNAGPETQALLSTLQPRLEPQLGHAPTAEAAPAEVETAASSPEYQTLAETLARKSSRWGSFSHADKAALLKQQAEAVWQAQPAERARLALDLAHNDQHELAGELLSREPALAADILQQPGFPAVRLLDNLKDGPAIDLMLGLARSATPEAQQVLSDTLEAFDAFFSFQDRTAPFAQLTQSPAFASLSPELQARIRDFVR